MDSAQSRTVEVPGEAEIDRQMVERGGLHAFTEVNWPRVQQAQPFSDSWHVGEICAHLEAVSAGEFRNLVINVPPGCSKSTIVAVMWPAWEWATVELSRQYIFATYSATLSRRDAIRHRNLVRSAWFQQRWPRVKIPFSERAAINFSNLAGGRRLSTSIKGGITGEHGNTIVVDDPTKPLDAEGRRAVLGTELDAAIDWWKGTMSTRQADPKTTRRVIIMQRLNTRDLAGHVIEEEDEQGWVHLRLPMEFESRFPCVTRPLRKRYLEAAEAGEEPEPRIEIGGDPRTEDGELLFPNHFDAAEVATLKKRLGPRGTASQLQQRPSPLEGAIFKAYWIQYWGYPGSRFANLPERIRLIQAWDMTFKGQPPKGKKRSFVAGQVWGAAGPDMFLLDQERGQWELTEQLRALARLTRRWPKAHRKLIEDAANGAAVVSAAKKKVAGLKLVPTGGGSEARAQAAATYFEGAEELEPGHVWLPHPSIAPWVVEYVEELLAFPNGANDDQVDATTHAVVYLGAGASKMYSEAMANIG